MNLALHQGGPQPSHLFDLDSVWQWLILTSQIRGKNLNPHLKAALIIIQLHKHHSIFIMFRAFFQTLYISFSLESGRLRWAAERSIKSPGTHRAWEQVLVHPIPAA